MTNLSGGRVNQKLRTRNALVEAAAQFVRDGLSFTVADVADAAMIGRTTAYRYFPTVDTLLAHASLYAVTDVEQHDIAKALDGIDAIDKRLSAVVEASDRSSIEHDYLYRTMLRTSLYGESHGEVVPKRTGARRQSLDAAIGGLRLQLGDKSYERLASALSLFLGIEASIVMRDVCLLSPVEARRVKLWGAQSLLEAAIEEAAQRKAAPRGSKAVPRGKQRSMAELRK